MSGFSFAGGVFSLEEDIGIHDSRTNRKSICGSRPMLQRMPIGDIIRSQPIGLNLCAMATEPGVTVQRRFAHVLACSWTRRTRRRRPRYSPHLTSPFMIGSAAAEAVVGLVASVRRQYPKLGMFNAY